MVHLFSLQNDFTDILSAALDESGIAGDFEEYNETAHQTVYQGQSQPIISVSTCIINQSQF